MATYFKVVLADMTIHHAMKGQDSMMAKIGYNAIVTSLEQKLKRVTDLIPTVFRTAVAMVSPGNVMPSVSPDDALVLVETSVEQTNVGKVGRIKAINNNAIAGMTQPGPAGVIMAVWPGRNGMNVDRITNAIIHEIGHAKSDLDEEMHDQNPNGILAEYGGGLGRSFLSSDVKWMSKYLPNQLTFDMRPFSLVPQ
jgi:hypothetical protein